MEFENLPVFIEHYKNDALAVDLQKFSSPAYNLYKERELQLNDAEFISEVEDIKQISEDCIRVFKAQLQRDLQHNLKGYVNGIYIFLPNMKLYLLYKDLYTEASQKLTIMQNKTALEPEYTIIDFIQFDLNLALGIIDKQIKLDDYRYYIISSNRELFDSITLGKYLQNLNNPNPYIKAILKEFLEKSKQIIDLDREVMPLIEKRAKEKDIYHHIDFKEHGFINLAFNYECIKINNITKSSINLSTHENREYFIKNNNYKIFEINQIAHKCRTILNRLSLFFEPEREVTNKKENPVSNLHSAIFQSNAFEVWQSMFNDFKINERSRTDVKFMFEEMKKEGLIHNTVSQINFWNGYLKLTE